MTFLTQRKDLTMKPTIRRSVFNATPVIKLEKSFQPLKLLIKIDSNITKHLPGYILSNLSWLSHLSQNHQ